MHRGKEPGVVETIPNPVTIGETKIGKGQPLALIAGPCVMEPGDMTLWIARRLAELRERLGIPLIFKASYRQGQQDFHHELPRSRVA